MRVDTDNQGISGDLVLRTDKLRLGGFFRPVELGGFGTLFGLLDAVIDVGPIKLDVDGSNFPSSQLSADNLRIEAITKGANLNASASGSLGCISTNVVDISTLEIVGVPLANADLMRFLCD